MAVISMGIEAPIIREGDNLVEIVVNNVLKQTNIDNNDVIGITESVVARAQGNYVTVDEIASEIKKLIGDVDDVALVYPIYSRNRFSMILKAFARTVKHVHLVMPMTDEVGNPRGTNPFTGVCIEDYYMDICRGENASVSIYGNYQDFCDRNSNPTVTFYCGLHDYDERKRLYNWYNLTDICTDKCQYGLLGSNKASEEKLKLFPNSNLAQKFVEDVRLEIFKQTNKSVHVMVYGDGCFKDPIGGIWEFADPVTSPAYTKELEGTPNEIKIKAFADDKFASLTGKDLELAVKNEIANKDKNLVGNMASQGTTPRRYVDLLASLMDLTSGSGDKGTPIVVVHGYFDNYATNK